MIYVGGTLLPRTCKINYVNMKMRLIYVIMQYNYVDLQHNAYVSI